MKHLSLVLGLLAAVASTAPVADNACDTQWVMVNPDGSLAAPSSSDASAAAADAPSSPTSAAAAGTSTVAPAGPIGSAPSDPSPGFKKVSCSAGSLAPVGMASFPINGDNLCAPEPTDPVPADAVVYTPSSSTIDLLDLEKWMWKVTGEGAKFIKIAPGIYSYGLGPVHGLSTDTNTVNGENIELTNGGGYTLDLRGVTLVITINAQNLDQRPGEMFYIGYTHDITILGGTVWIDEGDLWSYAVMQSMDNLVATFQVPEGFNRSAWLSATPNSAPGWVFCSITTDPKHYIFPECVQWMEADWDKSRLLSDGILKITAPGWAQFPDFQANFALSVPIGPTTMPTIGAEHVNNLVVKGMTTNGNFWQYGLQESFNTGVLDNCWIVQPPPRPDHGIVGAHGPIWFGDTISHANFYAERPWASKNSWFQASSSPYQLQDMNNGTAPTS
ncbi:MAG: hypothetical protein M1838_002961 [Thelocarpon superellum]|nr:MAG: hypothetical protein M1838_002961 [Thelocarpon superellum]